MASFKKIGVNRKINAAYSSRKFLESFGAPNVFFVFIFLLRLFLDFSKNNNLIVFLTLALFVITAIKQLIISYKFNDENRNQRKIAIGLSLIIIPLRILVMLLYAESLRNSEPILLYVAEIVTFDGLLVNLIVLYACIDDFRHFGWGLKEFYKCKTQKFDLSSLKYKN